MTTPKTNPSGVGRCPACGAAATGKFCQECGASTGPRPCPSCGTTLDAAARFCHRCGSPASGEAGGRPVPAAGSSAPASADRLPWLAAAFLITLAVGTIVWKVAGPAAPSPAGGGVGAAQPVAGAVPDISQMTPIERFIRLNDRIMSAASQGDSSTVQTFLPMALSAYTQLPAVDTDARYHAALLNVEAGNMAAARALADTILTAQPANLIGLALRGTLAELAREPDVLAEARRRFQAAWAAEIAKPNQEYVDHRNVLDAFRAGAGG